MKWLKDKCWTKLKTKKIKKWKLYEKYEGGKICQYLDAKHDKKSVFMHFKSKIAFKHFKLKQRIFNQYINMFMLYNYIVCAVLTLYRSSVSLQKIKLLLYCLRNQLKCIVTCFSGKYLCFIFSILVAIFRQ